MASALACATSPGSAFTVASASAAVPTAPRPQTRLRVVISPQVGLRPADRDSPGGVSAGRRLPVAVSQELAGAGASPFCFLDRISSGHVPGPGVRSADGFGLGIRDRILAVILDRLAPSFCRASYMAATA